MNASLTKLTGSIKKPFAAELQADTQDVIKSQELALSARSA